jgi:hypothetical protein
VGKSPKSGPPTTRTATSPRYASFGALADAKGAHRLRVRVQRSFHEIALDVPAKFFAEKNPLLHICDLYDAALCLRVLWILYHSHVQFFLAFAECDVGCAITGGDLKYV